MREMALWIRLRWLGLTIGFRYRKVPASRRPR